MKGESGELKGAYVNIFCSEINYYIEIKEFLKNENVS